jgi:hypothetical protein
MDNIYERARAAQIASAYGVVPQTIQKSEEATAVGETKEGETVVAQVADETAAVADIDATEKPLEKSEQGDIGGESKGTEPDDLQKGEIASALLNDYGNPNATFKFEKTGKELKEILPKTITSLSVIKDTLLAQLGIFQTSIGSVPSDSRKSYRVPSVSVPFYSYDLSRRIYNEMTSDYEPLTDAQVTINSYNDLAWRLCDVLEDIAVCQLIVDNIEDSKKYNLSVSQLVAINIG